MPKPATRHLVSTDWLAEHLGDQNLVVVDGSWHLPATQRNGLLEYLAAHIPSAVYFDIDEIADHSSPLPHMLPPPKAFALHMVRLGIGDGMKIVVYDGVGLFSAARVWWSFLAFGVKDVKILEGGFPKWCADGHPVEKDMVTRKPAKFTARFNRRMIAGIDQVEAILKSGSAQVVDSRSAERFRGDAPEPRPGVRAGHMPGSRNVPYMSVIENGTLASPEKIRAALAQAGVDPEKPVVTSCGSGVTASILAFAIDTLGKPPGRVYDGSWVEWGGRQDTPVVKG